jgi:hypothetical protein
MTFAPTFFTKFIFICLYNCEHMFVNRLTMPKLYAAKKPIVIVLQSYVVEIMFLDSVRRLMFIKNTTFWKLDLFRSSGPL